MAESITHLEELPRSQATTSKSSSGASTLGVLSHPTLPHELLCMVFKEIATPQAAKSLNGLGVLALSHVCRIWRSIVVAEPSLWCHINLRAGRRCTRLYLRHSQELPVTLYLSLNGLPLLDDVLDAWALRIQAIHVDEDPLPSGRSHRRHERESISLLHSFSSHVPRLECFSLRASLDSTLNDYTPFSWSLFAEDTSPLRALHLDLGGPMWDWMPTNSFPMLTHLCLSFGSVSGHYSAEGLLRALSQAPMLEYLHFVGINLDIEYSETPLPEPSLDHLHILSFHHSDIEVAFFLLRHLELPEDFLLCIGDAMSQLNFAYPGADYSDALDVPPLDLFDTITFIELSASFGGFILAGYDAQSAPESGFFIDATSCKDMWPWFERLHTMLPFSNITVLHANLDQLAGVEAIFPSFLTHFPSLRELSFLLSRQWAEARDFGDETLLIEQFFRALLHTDAQDVACPALEVLGLEAELAHGDFPFDTLEAVAASRMRAGRRLPRFVFHPHTNKHGTERTRRRFSASFAQLEAFVGEVEYRRAGDAKVCPFVPPGCWDDPEAERYWRLPRTLWYELDADVADLENSDSESGSVESVADDRGPEMESTDTEDAVLVS